MDEDEREKDKRLLHSKRLRVKRSCKECSEFFYFKTEFNEHVKQAHPYQCEICLCSFIEEIALETHLASKHGYRMRECPDPSCNFTHANPNQYELHIINEHPLPQPSVSINKNLWVENRKYTENPPPNNIVRSAFRKTALALYLPILIKTLNVEIALNSIKNRVFNHLKEYMDEKGSIKWTLNVMVDFVKYSYEDNSDKPLEDDRHFVGCTRKKILHTINDFYEQYNQKIDHMNVELQKFTERGSGFQLIGINGVDVIIYNMLPGKMGDFIPTPDNIPINKQKYIINVKTDGNCLKYSIMAALANIGPHKFTKKSAEDPKTYDKYGYEKKFHYDKVSFESTIKDIDNFEKDNSTIAINIYAIQCVNKTDTDMSEEELKDIKMASNIQNEDEFLQQNPPNNDDDLFLKNLSILRVSPKLKKKKSEEEKEKALLEEEDEIKRERESSIGTVNINNDA